MRVPVEIGDFLRISVRVRIPHGPGADQLRRVPDEGGRVRIVCGTGLAGDGASDGSRFLAGAVLHSAFHRFDDQSAVVLLEHAVVTGFRGVQLLVVGAEDFGHAMQCVLDPAGGDGRVGLREFLDGHRVDAEHVVRRCFVDIARNARGMRDFRGFLRCELLVEPHVRRVDGEGGRLVQVHIAVADVAGVGHRTDQTFEGLRRVAVEHGVEADAGLCGSEQSEGFHRRARLIGGLRGVVELVGQIIGAAVNRFDAAVARVRRYGADLHTIRHAGRPVVSYGLHLVLQGGIESRHNLVSAGFQLILGECLGIDQLLFDHGQ